MMDTYMTSQVDPTMHDGGLLMGAHWLWVVFWVVVVASLMWVVARIAIDRRGTRNRQGAERDAEEELRGRFARGEVDQREYERRLAVLREGFRRP